MDEMIKICWPIQAALLCLHKHTYTHPWAQSSCVWCVLWEKGDAMRKKQSREIVEVKFPVFWISIVYEQKPIHTHERHISAGLYNSSWMSNGNLKGMVMPEHDDFLDRTRTKEDLVVVRTYIVSLPRACVQRRPTKMLMEFQSMSKSCQTVCQGV